MFDVSPSLPPCNRRHPRHVVGLYSELEIEGLRYGCHLVDISRGGARLCDVIVAVGEHVKLMISAPASGIRRAIPGRVVWTRGSQAGVQFLEPLGSDQGSGRLAAKKADSLPCPDNLE